MPSTKKRINLTVPDEIYEQIQEYKKSNGLTNDATACLQLIVRQLNGAKAWEQIVNMVRSSTAEQVLELSNQGAYAMKELVDQTAAETT